MSRDLRPDGLAERFGGRVTSQLGRRLALAHLEHHIGFPRFSDDPFEQWLVEEALVAGWVAVKDVARAEAERQQRSRQAMAEAHQRGREELEGLRGV